MSVNEAEKFFGDGDARTPAAHKVLDRLADVGLGYLTIGQPLTTLSGGERQRLKLATHMGEKGASMSSTSRPRACTSPTSSSCSGCWTSSSTPASRSSSSSTTRGSWRTPTGSSTSAQAPATTAAGSFSRARPPTSSPRAPPSPESTSRTTSKDKTYGVALRAAPARRRGLPAQRARPAAGERPEVCLAALDVAGAHSPDVADDRKHLIALVDQLLDLGENAAKAPVKSPTASDAVGRPSSASGPASSSGATRSQARSLGPASPGRRALTSS